LSRPNPDFVKSDSSCRLDDTEYFFVREYLRMGILSDPFLRHAVKTPQVAAIRDGNPEIINAPVEPINYAHIQKSRLRYPYVYGIK
jgi:hypothetical protein